MSSKTRDQIKFTLIGLWLIFTVAFALWWLTFSIQHISLLEHLDPTQRTHWQRQRRMVFWEGTTWLVLLALGGGALKSDPAFDDSEILERLVGDTVRLQLQLENSLFLASQESLKMHTRKLNLRKIMDRLDEQWPGIKIELISDCEVEADERALHTILSNLIQNSVLHGGATQITIAPRTVAVDRIVLEVCDNGRGFEGARQELGRLFHRPKSTSGSGLGLFICRLLSEKMQGGLELPNAQKGFRAELTLPGAVS